MYVMLGTNTFSPRFYELLCTRCPLISYYKECGQKVNADSLFWFKIKNRCHKNDKIILYSVSCKDKKGEKQNLKFLNNLLKMLRNGERRPAKKTKITLHNMVSGGIMSVISLWTYCALPTKARNNRRYFDATDQ